MSSAAGTESRTLVDRAKAILMKPKEEWPVIAAEKTEIAALYRTYVIPLAAIGPVANAIGGALIGTNLVGVGAVRVPFTNAVVGAVIAFALSLLGTYVVARVIDYLAPRYGGTRDLTGAFKVSAYSSTAQWLVGIFALIPALSALSILGLYGLYLLYLGLPVVMKVPAEKAMSYTVAVVVAVILVFIVIGIVSGIVIGTAAFATL
ncbi:MAG: YIP1 family protein [Chloroflexi bacterium]|nr:MAG: YIP1 family protein [Chloroflexota bacterium]